MKKSFITLKTVGAAIALTAFAGSAGAQAPSEARVKELLAQAQIVVQQQAAAPAAQAPAAQTLNLSMDDAVAKAIDQNIDLTVARLSPQIQDLTLAQAKGFYIPTLSGTFGQRSQTQNPGNIYGGGALVNNSTMTFNAGLAQALPWWGGTANLNWTNSRLDSTNQGNTINPNYTSNLIAQLTQPLLRNRGIDANRQSLITAEINRRLADVSLRSTTINTVANTRNAYWDLVYAVQAVDAARQSLALAQKLVEDNKSRVEIGTMAPIDVVSAQSEAAARQLALVQAVATRQTTEITLKRLLVAGTTDPLWNATLNPTDRPTIANDKIDVESALRKALTERTDLIQARENLKISDVSMKYLRNQTQMGLDLTASYAAGATAGPVGRWIAGQWVTITPGGYMDALRHDPRGSPAHLEPGGDDVLSARQQRAGSELRPLEGPVPAVAGAGPLARAARRDRHHQRRADGEQQPGAGAGVGRLARAGAEEARSRAEQVRGGHGHQLRGRPGAARPERRGHRGTAGDPQLPEVARRLPAAAGDLVERHAACRPGPAVRRAAAGAAAKQAGRRESVPLASERSATPRRRDSRPKTL